MSSFEINGKNLSLDSLEKIACQHQQVSLSKKSEKKMQESLALLSGWMKEGKTIYGVNTGVGALSDKKIPSSKLDQLQLNIIRSHAAGVGPAFNEPEVRAITLLRAQVLASGYSGVRPLVAKTLLAILNKNIIPVIPQKGSVGASGDLAPLAHLALSLIGEGEVIYKGKQMLSKSVFKAVGIPLLRLTSREGIALINGTQVMAALSALNLLKAGRLLQLFDVSAALSLEAIQGSRRAFDPDIHALRPHPGQLLVAKNIWKLIQKSQIQLNHKYCGKVQDAYSFRCTPQVHGSSRDAYEYIKKIVETEINSVTDNPLFFAKKSKWLSGGNFHGQYLSQAMDILGIAMATVVNISERRLDKLLDPKFSELPAFLVKDSGISSGLMSPHYTAAALASENKVLAHPASVDTIPTSVQKEDHVSMGPHAARKAKEILKNAEDVLAIEFLAASQGIYLLRPLKTSAHLEKVVKIIRKKVPPITVDRIFAKDIQNIKLLFPEILSAVKGVIA